MQGKLTDEQVAELQSLEQQQGRLSPLAVVEAARAATSTLHELFQWDDERAGQEYRITQARAIIRVIEVKVVRSNFTVTVPRYVHDPELPGNREGYRDLLLIGARPELSALTVLAEVKRSFGVVQRAASIAEALNLEQAAVLGTCAAMLAKVRQELEGGDTALAAD